MSTGILPSSLAPPSLGPALSPIFPLSFLDVPELLPLASGWWGQVTEERGLGMGNTAATSYREVAEAE